jgi:hypothetical protein
MHSASHRVSFAVSSERIRRAPGRGSRIARPAKTGDTAARGQMLVRISFTYERSSIRKASVPPAPDPTDRAEMRPELQVRDTA